MNEISHRGTEVSLVAQLNKLARHNRQGSFRTKDRYYQAMKRFCRYLAEQYHLQKLSNVNVNHLANYVLYLQETGKSAGTIKTDLAAIRFFHDKMDNPKYGHVTDHMRKESANHMENFIRQVRAK